MSVTVTTPPTIEPIHAIGLDQVKTHLRVDHDDENELLKSACAAAFDFVESLAWRQLLAATLTLRLDRFDALPCGTILLPRSPARAVDSIEYLDADGVSQTLAATEYDVDLNSEPARIRPVDRWPATYCKPNAVTIQFQAGYDSHDDIPALLLHAVKLVIADFYEHRTPGESTRVAVCELVKLHSVHDHRLAEFV